MVLRSTPNISASCDCFMRGCARCILYISLFFSIGNFPLLPFCRGGALTMPDDPVPFPKKLLEGEFADVDDRTDATLLTGEEDRWSVKEFERDRLPSWLMQSVDCPKMGGVEWT